MRTALSLLGVVCCLTGGVWILQGVGLLKGSFMTGSAFWAVVGAATLAAGVSLLLLGRARSPRG